MTDAITLRCLLPLSIMRLTAPLVALLIGALLPSTAAHAEDVYIEARPQSASDHVSGGGLMLRAALEASKPLYGPYKILQAPAMERARMLQEMQEGRLVNIGVQTTSREWEQSLIPIRIPVDKGLSSFRVALIDGRRQAEFSHITSLAQLQRMAVGVGAQWPTRALYEKGGLRVVAGTSHEGLYGMLMAGRFDYYPRITEDVVQEQAELVASYPHIAIEQSFILYTLTPRYFFVSPTAPRLAERLRMGMEKLVASGEFDRLFAEYYGPILAQTHLCSRIVFKVGNSDLSPQTPLQRSQLWFDPFSPSGKLACQFTKSTAPKSARP